MAYELRKTDENVLICEGAVVVGNVTIGKGSSIWYNAVLRGDKYPIVVGENTSIQDCCVLHGDTKVGNGCTVGHTAILHGCTIGDNVLVGMGSIVLNNARIGDNCIIGAGAVVTGKMDAPAGSLILGNPARVIRPLTEAEIEGNREAAREYQENMKHYEAGKGNAG